jgi:hypothetical protein
VDGPDGLAADLYRSPDAITSQARRLGLRSPHRHRRQALARALRNRTVNAHFFDTPSEQVAFVLGYVWVRGRVKPGPHHVLRLRCPTAEEDHLLAVRGLLESRHHVQRREGYTVCEICSAWLVKNLIRKYGCPPCRDLPDPPLPTLPAAYVPYLARGLLVGAGSVDDSRITWVGTSRAMRELEDIILAATGISAPEKGRLGQCHSLSWHTPQDVRALAAWLRLNWLALEEEARKGDSSPLLLGAPDFRSS